MSLEQFKYLCLTGELIQRPLIVCICYLSLLHLFRYVVLINLGQRKNLITINEEKGNIKIGFRILKFIGRWYFNILLIIIIFFASMFANLIFFISESPFDCNENTGPFIVLYFYDGCLYLIFNYYGL